MRGHLDAEGLPEFGPLVYQGDKPPIVRAEELAQDQHGKQLRLGELVGALGAGIIGKGLLSGGKSRRRQRDWILGCSAHEGLCRS